MNGLNSETQLHQLLEANGIDISGWGAGGYKSLSDLWQEIQDGETILQENPLRREIIFVQVVIRHKNYLLIETKQEMVNGSVRVRNRPLSEKMQPGESVKSAALRGLQQELNLSPEQITILPIGFLPLKAETASLSYPGLLTHYTIHTIETTVTGLPLADFSTHEANPADPVRKHFWRWLTESEAEKLFHI